ncbi:MAG TPA: hypothetical protein VI603_12055 [Saprospiraceae bacterium]|nr:hypothetical protein [Saprospiraceae bacterium]
MSRQDEKIHAHAIELYEKLIEMHPAIERKGKTLPYTSVNGHMFSFMSKEGEMGLRLPTPERDAFIKRHKARMMEQYGREMKEYVAVPFTLLSDTLNMLKYLQNSYEYVSSLKPKKKKNTIK